MKNFWRIALLGYLFGMFALIVCVAAVVMGIVEDMGISLLLLPVICPVILNLFARLSKYTWEKYMYGQGAFWRWSLIGLLAGLFYTIRVYLGEQAMRSGLFGALMIFVLLSLFWLIFFLKRGQLNEIEDQES